MRVPGSAGGRARAVLALVLTVALLAPAGAQAAGADGKGPEVDAATWVLVDPVDGERLAAHEPESERAIASTTKLMTAYLTLRELPLDRKLKVPPYSPAPAESVAGLVKGERLTVHDLLEALLLASANDAAVTLADGVAGSQPAFVTQMNRAAARLGLDHTHYANPIGLDAKGNYSSASDLVELATGLLDDRTFRRIVAEPRATLRSGSQKRVVVNTNTLLLSDPSVDGVKTGHTTDAGYVLVASAKRGGVPLIAAVLGAPSEPGRDIAAEELLDYGYSLYDRRTIAKKGESVDTAEVRYEDEALPLLAKREVALSVRRDQRVKVDVDAPAEVEGPIAAGDRLGSLTVTVDGRFADRTPLVAGRAVDEPTIVDRIGGPLVVAGALLALIVILAGILVWVRRRHEDDGPAQRDPEERMRTREERIRRRDGGDGG